MEIIKNKRIRSSISSGLRSYFFGLEFAQTFNCSQLVLEEETRISGYVLELPLISVKCIFAFLLLFLVFFPFLIEIKHLNVGNFCYRKVVKSFIQGLLPGIALKIFLILLPTILMIMSKIEGFTSLSSLERRSAAKYHLFLLVNVFLGSIITGTALQQLHRFLNESPAEYVS